MLDRGCRLLFAESTESARGANFESDLVHVANEELWSGMGEVGDGGGESVCECDDGA
jgi:hypothetical protein